MYVCITFCDIYLWKLYLNKVRKLFFLFKAINLYLVSFLLRNDNLIFLICNVILTCWQHQHLTQVPIWNTWGLILTPLEGHVDKKVLNFLNVYFDRSSITKIKLKINKKYKYNFKKWTGFPPLLFYSRMAHISVVFLVVFVLVQLINMPATGSMYIVIGIFNTNTML